MLNDAQSPRPRLYWIALLLVILAAAALRLWRIDSLPPGFHFDESFEGLEAWRILTDPAYHPIFLTGNFGVPPLNAYLNAGMFWLFGRFGGQAGPTAMRVTAALVGVLGVLLVYALATELRRFDRQRLTPAFPLLAAAALALMRWHIHFSRIGIEPVIVPALWAGATWLFLRGWRTGQWWSFVGSGVFLAAGMYTYQAAWVIPFLMIGVVGHLVIVEYRKLKIQDSRLVTGTTPRLTSNLQSSISPPRAWGILLTVVTATLLFAPLAWFFANNIDLVFLRPTQLAIVGETASPADASVWTNAWATLRMFGPFGLPGDLDPRRNLPGAPALNLWLALPFYAGLMLAIWRVRSPAYSIPLIGLIGLLLPGIFSEYAPHFHRVLGASAPVAILIGVGLDAVWRWGGATQKPGFSKKPGFFSHGGGGRRWLAAPIIAGLLILGGVTSARNYFVYWAALPDLFYAFDAGIWELGQWTAEAAQPDPVYITPRGDEHATLAFAWRTLPPDQRPVSFDGRHIFPLADDAPTQPQHYAVIEHEDFRTRLLLPDVLPGAMVTEEMTDDQGKVYARVYTRPGGSEAARSPLNPRPVAMDDAIQIAGYDVQPAELHPGEVLYVQLHWLVSETPGMDWTVFIHLVDPVSGAVVAGHDSRPGAGSLPTTRWQPGWRVLDEIQIDLPADLPPGEYGLRMGLYQPGGERLPIDGSEIELGAVAVR